MKKEKLRKIRDILFTIILVIFLIYYFYRHHQTEHIILGIIAIIMIAIMYWAENTKSNKQKAVLNVLVGVIWILTNSILILWLKIQYPDSFGIYKSRIFWGTAIATLTPIFLFYRAYRFNKKK